MKGYLNNQEETKASLRKLADGNVWLYTGDLGHMDEDGTVFFDGRIKRMIITNGNNVFPGNIENVIDSIDEVAYSCAIGVKDERRGQRIKAYVVLRDGVERNDVIKDKIMDVLKEKLDLFEIPKEIEFKEELPRTLIGKVNYRLLEKEAGNQATDMELEN